MREKSADQQYDEVADRTSEVERVIRPYRDEVEIPSLCRVLGSVHGKRVLDAGCGGGAYARLVKQRGASQVVGIDVSSGMIEVAQAIERERPLGVKYHVYDVAVMPVLDAFDVVIAVHVLHYACSRHVLAGMCERLCANLVSGGRLLAFVGNPECEVESAETYGFAIDRPAHLHDGDAFTISILTTPPTTVQVYYWTSRTLTEVLESSGFTDVTWETLTSSHVTNGALPSLFVSARKR